VQEEHTAENGAMNTVRRQDRRYQNARSVIYTYSYSYTYMFHSMSLAMVNSKDKLESNRSRALAIVSFSTRACVCHQKLDSGHFPPTPTRTQFHWLRTPQKSPLNIPSPLHTKRFNLDSTKHNLHPTLALVLYRLNAQPPLRTFDYPLGFSLIVYCQQSI
jgi:hypothetical protein